MTDGLSALRLACTGQPRASYPCVIAVHEVIVDVVKLTLATFLNNLTEPIGILARVVEALADSEIVRRFAIAAPVLCRTPEEVQDLFCNVLLRALRRFGFEQMLVCCGGGSCQRSPKSNTLIPPKGRGLM